MKWHLPKGTNIQVPIAMYAVNSTAKKCAPGVVENLPNHLEGPPRGGGGVGTRPRSQGGCLLNSGTRLPPSPLCDIPSGCCSFTGPWTVTRSSLRMLRRVAAFCRPLRPVLLLVSFPRSRSPGVGLLGMCWMWQYVPFARQRRPIIDVLRMCWLLPGSFDCFCCPRASVHMPSVACLAASPSLPSGPTPLPRVNSY